MFEIRNYLQIILVMIIRIVILFFDSFNYFLSRILSIWNREKNIKDDFRLKTWWKDAVVWTRIAKARCETSSMYQSRGKHARHGGNCANRIINTFRPLHYGCNERFLCTFPCADFAPLFARTCDRSMHSRAKIRIQGKDSTFTVINNDRWIRVSYLWLSKTIFTYISINI